VMMIKEEE